MKRKLTKEAFEKLSDEMKGEYKEKDGEYVLTVDGDVDTGALTRAKDRLSEEKKEAKAKLKIAEDALKAAEAKLGDLSDDDAKKRGDVATLEKSWQAKLDAANTSSAEKISKKDAFISKALVNDVAKDIAAKFKNPVLMLPHIKVRLAADLDGDEPSTKVLDKDGQPSALTIDELSKELFANVDFADMVIVSKASGSSTPTTKAPSGSADEGSDLLKMSDADLMAEIEAKIETKG